MEISIEVHPGSKINLYSKCIDDVTRNILRASFEDESPLDKGMQHVHFTSHPPRKKDRL